MCSVSDRPSALLALHVGAAREKTLKASLETETKTHHEPPYNIRFDQYEC